MLSILEPLKFKKVDDLPTYHTQGMRYNYLLGMVMLYMMFMILSGLSVYKMIQIFPGQLHLGTHTFNLSWIILPAGLLVIPFAYSISNIVTEVYGYAVARNMVWWFIVASFVFTLFGTVIAALPHESLAHLHGTKAKIFSAKENAVGIILGHMSLVFLAGTLGFLVSLTFNNFVVSKLKVLLHGKRYWIRSIISTVGGELAFNVIAYPIMYHAYPLKHIFFIMLSAGIYKFIATCFIWPLECLVANFLKIKEGINIIDYNVRYNLFKFNVNPNKTTTSDLHVIK